MKETWEDFCRTHPGVTWKEYVDMRFVDASKAEEIARLQVRGRDDYVNERFLGIDKRFNTLQQLAFGALVSGLIALLAVILTHVLGNGK